MPETVFPNTDFAGAFFGVSVNKDLTAEQCGEFGEKKTVESTPAVSTTVEAKSETSTEGQASVEDQGKRVLGDSELACDRSCYGQRHAAE